MSGQVELVDEGRCGLCMAKINNDGLGVHGNTYHENCFNCIKCSEELSNDNFGEIGILGPVCKNHVKGKTPSTPSDDVPESKTSVSSETSTSTNPPPQDDGSEEKVGLKKRPTIDINEANNSSDKANSSTPGDDQTPNDEEIMDSFLSPTSGKKRFVYKNTVRGSQVFEPNTPNVGDKVDSPLFDGVDDRLKQWENFESSDEIQLNIKRYQEKKQIIKDIALFEKKPYRYKDAVQCNVCEKWCKKEDEVHHAEAHPTLIYPRLFLGDELDAQRKEELEHIGVKHVLNVADYCGPFHVEHFNYLHLHIDDIPKQDIRPFFNQVFEFLDAALSDPESGSVLVHCIMGVSRSAALCIAYIMRENKWSLSETINNVQGKRNCVNPNYGFLTQLVEYDIELNGSSDFRIDVWRRQNEDNWK